MRLSVGFFVLLTLWGCGPDRAEAPPKESGTAVASVVPRRAERQRVVFFGDSITAGNGLDPARAYPNVLQQRIDEEGWPFEAVNAGVSGETSAGGLRRIDWVLRNPIDVLVLALGANDGLRGLPVAGMKSNLKTIIQKVRQQNPDVSIIVAGMRMPPNLGAQYASDFGEAFGEVAQETGADLVPFLLEDVAGRPTLNQLDGIHPTAKGQTIVADNVWETLEPVLKRRLSQEIDS